MIFASKSFIPFDIRYIFTNPEENNAMTKVLTIVLMIGCISYCNQEMASDESSTMEAEAPSCSETVPTTITGTIFFSAVEARV
jgi:hypothetical protein